MRQPNPTLRRVAIALAGPSLAFAGCQRQAEAPAKPAPPPPAAAAPQAPPVPQLPTPALGRSELLRALDAAGSAYAAQRPDGGEDLAGRRFAVRQAFGCPGSRLPQEGQDEGFARWSWGPGKKTIEISLRPADWRPVPLMADGDSHWEAVEGYWLTWPWLLNENCPAAPPTAVAAQSASPQAAGLAAVFERGGSRVGRRDGTAFSFTIRAHEGPPLPSTNGYRLVLEGRLTAFPGGRAIRCRSRGPDERPVCIAAAEVDRVAFEDGAGHLLSEWQPR